MFLLSLESPGGSLHQLTGVSVVMPTLHTGTPGPPVGPGKAALPEGSLYSWAPHSGSRPVEAGTEAWGMEPPPRGGAADLEGVQPGSSRLVCVSRDLALSTLFFFLTHPAPLGLHAMVHS